MFPRVRPGYNNVAAFAVLTLLVSAMIYCLGAVIAGFAILAGFPKLSLWAVILLGCLGVAAMALVAYWLSKRGYLTRQLPWYYRFILNFAVYTVFWLGLQLYQSGLERLDLFEVFMFPTIMTCAMMFLDRKLRKNPTPA